MKGFINLIAGGRNMLLNVNHIVSLAEASGRTKIVLTAHDKNGVNETLFTDTVLDEVAMLIANAE